jgi:iron complex transport system ATP-binding protein
MKLDAIGVTVRVGDATLVSNASLAVGAGEFVGLIGPNGAGKSTLLRAIVGIRPRDDGAVTLDGRMLGDIPARERARKLAFLPQERRVEWRLRVRDLVMLGRYPHHSGIGGASAADTAAVAKAMAEVDAVGLEDRIAATLSAGEKARVLLARALAVEAPVLIADEPIAALDPYHQLHVMEILQAQAKAGAAVLVVLHDLSLAARFMDRLVLMSKGEIVADGAPADVLSDARLSAVYRVEVLRNAHARRQWMLPWARDKVSNA